MQSKKTKLKSNYNNESHNLKLLNETEKSQLLALQRTREKIVQELQKYPSATNVLTANGGNDFNHILLMDSFYNQTYSKVGSNQSTEYGSLIGTSQSQTNQSRINTGQSTEYGTRVSSSQLNANSSRVSTSQSTEYSSATRVSTSQYQYSGSRMSTSNFKTGLDMIPILASTGESALEVGLNKKGKVRLPIFKLPPVDSFRFLNRLPKERKPNNGFTGSQFSMEIHFMPCNTIEKGRKVLVDMIARMDTKSTQFVTNYLRMNSNDISDIANEIEKKLSSSNSISNRHDNEKVDISDHISRKFKLYNRHSIEEYFVIDEKKNLFMKALEVIRSGNIQLNEERIMNELSNHSNSNSNSRLGTGTQAFGIKLLEHSLFAGKASQNQMHNAPFNISATRLQAISTLGYSKGGTNNINFINSIDDNRPKSRQVHTADLGTSGHHAGHGSNANAQKDNELRKMQSMPSLSALTQKKKDYEPTLPSSATIYVNTQNSKSEKLFSGTAPSTAFSTVGRSSTAILHPLNTYKKNKSTANTPKSKSLKRNDSTISTDDLTTELINSLKNMEKYSTMVKQGLASVKNIVPVHNDKAKVLLYSVAADTMKKAMNIFLLYEMRRGWISWILYIQQQRRKERMGQFILFLSNRNIILGLNRIIQKKLTIYMQQWIQFTVEENRRVMRLRLAKAIILIQTHMRRFISTKKVKALRQRKKYQRLYDAVINIQAMLRGSLTRWRIKKAIKDKKELAAACYIQRMYRGYRGRKRVRLFKLKKNKEVAVIMIQKMARCRMARTVVHQKRRDHIRNNGAIRIQSLIRGFVARRTISKALIDKARYKYAIRIQALMRGVLSRMHRIQHLREIEEYRYYRNKSVTMIQSAYRGYRSRLLYKMMLFKKNKEGRRQNEAVTKINRVVRGYLAMATLKKLKKSRLRKWILDARMTKELWSEEAETWYYYNSTTGEQTWEPGFEGYTKSDGQLVLYSGEIIDDPETLDETDEEKDFNVTAKGGARKEDQLCSECVHRVAIRQCHDCGDQYCTICYKGTHASGSRLKHTYTAIGPLDCTECEALLAERWCVACDEAFCDSCWRKVHARGKRVFHPFSVVHPTGKIDSKILTMDGTELNGYDSGFSQAKHEQQQEASYLASSGTGSYQPIEEDLSTIGMDAEWTQYMDDNGYEYWYNNYTGISQYENPYY